MLISQVTCTEECIKIVQDILFRRRGHILEQEALEATPLTFLKIEIPAIESFGFETDV